MKYFLERNNLFDNSFTIDLDDFKKYFFQTYKYFEDRELFDVAYNGVWNTNQNFKQYQVFPPKMSPSPEIFFMNHLDKDDVYPIWEHYEYYEEVEIFTVIEILFDHICSYDYREEKFMIEEHKLEFATHINNLLKRYKSGYYLDMKYGFIMEEPNDAINALMNTEFPETMDKTVLEQLKTAVKMYYRFDSSEESKKKAINILADVLEPLRTELKEILNKDHNISMNVHDKLIFGIVNEFDIRHNNKKQFTKYSKPIWHDWMMQYYTSIIFTYYRLKKINE